MVESKCWFLLLAAPLLALAGCMSVVEGTDQKILIATTPSGATCDLEREGKVIMTVAKTPVTVAVAKSKYDLTIKCNKPGYRQASYLNRPTVRAGDVALDIFVTAGVSSIIDALNGANNHYEPAVVITLEQDVAATR
jgi:hypothetical protein